MQSSSISLSGASATAIDSQLFRSFSDSVRFAFGNDSQLVFNIVSGGREIMPMNAVILLQACSSFATLDEHLSSLAARFQIPEQQLPIVRNNLKKFVDIGLLLSRQSLIEQCTNSAPETRSQGAQITAVGVPTCNRPENLHACLTSLAESRNLCGRDLRFVVADDSHDDSIRAANVDCLRAIAKSFSLKISYLGKEEKERFADALANESGLSRSIVDFAILNPESCPISTGANRNNLLLSTVGEAFLHCDDDVICRGAEVAEATDGLTLSSVFDPQQTWFDEESIASDAWPGVDVFSWHEKLLGKSVAQCVENSRGQIDIDKAHAIMFRRLQSGGGRVLVTSLGTAGDSGMGLSTQFLLYDDEERSRLMQSEQFYRHASQTHRQLRAVLSPTITDAWFCMNMNSGLDNRVLLPPFNPVGRNSDAIFGRLLRATVYDGMFGFLPLSVVHHKTTGTLREDDAGFVRMANICYLLVNSEATRHFHSKDTGCNLTDIGGALIDIGSLPLDEFEERVQSSYWNLHANRVAELHRLLEKYGGQPAYWANDVLAYISQLQSRVVDRNYVVPVDLAAKFGDETARKLAPKLIYRFGQLLSCWEILRRAAANLPSYALEIM
ncbi:MAG TPA: glycosyltransferase family A protein [Planktothrix sp.]|jgi:hypothetical protein